jgi:tetratricopeptide (TPR) repeat protein
MIRLGKITPFKAILVVVLLLAAVMLIGCSKKVSTPVETEVPVPPTDGHYLDHTVAEGETLGQVADNYYGDPRLADRIAKDNGISDPARIISGSVLRLKFSDDEWESARKRSAALVPYNKGVDLLGEERLAEAEKQFSLALETAPDLVAAKYNLALVLLKRGKTEQALVLLEELTEQRPTDTDFLFARGNALFQSTRFDDAAVQFRAALEVDPRLKRAAFGLARSLQEAEHKDQAIVAWNRYLELDSTTSWAEAARRNLKLLQADGGS